MLLIYHIILLNRWEFIYKACNIYCDGVMEVREQSKFKSTALFIFSGSLRSLNSFGLLGNKILHNHGQGSAARYILLMNGLNKIKSAISC